VPVPIDVQDFDYNIDPDDLLSVVDNDFGAIIVVHIFGKPANMEAIMDISKKYGVPVIEDCAEAHGATFHGKAVGSFGIAGCFSFYANKIIGTGEGGAITTDNKEFFDTISKLKSLSFGQHNKFLHSADGYNFRMTNIQAALGLSQISNLKKTLEIKSTIARIYDAYLFDNVNLIIPKIEINDGSVTWMYHLRVACGHKACRDKIIAEMAKRGFELRPGFIPFSDQTDVLSKFEIKTRSTPFASIAGNSAFYLPTSLDLKSRQQAKISRNLIEIVNGLHCERMT
jgi:perosamine synthetase